MPRRPGRLPVFEENRKQIDKAAIASICKPDMIKTTLLASMLATGAQGGHYTLATWVPTYLKTERGLTVIGTGSYLAFLISGALSGYLAGANGYLLFLGFPLGFCSSAIFAGVTGFLATRYGIGGAMAFGVLAYSLVMLALFWPPETAGQDLA